MLFAQVGIAEEPAFGTITTPTRFLDFNSESITATYARTESKGLRAGRLYRDDARFTTFPEGAAGDLNLEVGSKGFGVLLKHMLGAVATSGSAATGYTHTATPANLLGKSLTVQVGRDFYDGSSVSPFTYAGCKIVDWEISNGPGDNLVCKLGVDAQREETATALAVASFPTGIEQLAWMGGVVTVAGTQVDVTDVKVSGDNKLRTDRRYLRSSALKKEQIGEDFRSGAFSFKCDFDSLAHRNRVAAASAAGAVAQVVLKWQGFTQIATGVLPALTVTINARFDKWAATIGGPDPTDQQIDGVYLGQGALSMAYLTSDATP